MGTNTLGHLLKDKEMVSAGIIILLRTFIVASGKTIKKKVAGFFIITAAIYTLETLLTIKEMATASINIKKVMSLMVIGLIIKNKGWGY